MMDWTVARIVEATGGRLTQGNPEALIPSIATDSRQVGPGDGFVALIGENHDAHDFIREVAAKGAGAIIIARERRDRVAPIPQSVSVVEVKDTLSALGDLARFHRLRRDIPVAAITGSNGKTSTKEILAGILGLRRKTLKTQGNFNNLIGLPLTLLGLETDHEVAVVEMGINMRGEMDRLVRIGVPTVGIITNIQPAHLEGLGSLDGILAEKGKLWLALKPDGLAVVNLDDARLAEFSKRLSLRTVTASLRNPSADVRLESDVRVEDGQSLFSLALGGESVEIRFPVLGTHQVFNAMVAAAAAWGMGESIETIQMGLAAHQAVKGRMQVHRLKDGRVLVDDTYNANPGSTLAALQTVRAASVGRPLTAVLGEMRELGPQSASLHQDLGRKLAGLGVNSLIALGEMGREICSGAEEAGMQPSACFRADSHEEAFARLQESCRGGEWILVKGSRAMTMERVVERVLAA